MGKRRGRPAKKLEVRKEYSEVYDKEVLSPPPLPDNHKKCPRCGSPNTLATHTDGEIVDGGRAFVLQWRKCQSATCRYSYKTAKPS